MIASDMAPFSTVEQVGFQRLLRELEPRYKIPSRIHFSRVIVPDIYKAVRKSIQTMINDAGM